MYKRQHATRALAGGEGFRAGPRDRGEAERIHQFAHAPAPVRHRDFGGDDVLGEGLRAVGVAVLQALRVERAHRVVQVHVLHHREREGRARDRREA